MTQIYKSDKCEITWHAEGFVEFVVQETYELETADLVSMREYLLAAGLDKIKLLINRLHHYSTSASILIPPHPRFEVQLIKVAFLVYSDSSGIISDFVSDLVLPVTPHRVFYGNREAAIKWLLDDAETE